MSKQVRSPCLDPQSMSEILVEQEDLKRLAESLKGTGRGIRTWIAALKEADKGEGGLVVRQLERASQYLERSVRALRTPGKLSKDSNELSAPGLSGSTTAVPVASLVSFMAEISASGVLRIYGAGETYVLQFDAGYLIYAHGDNPPEGMLLGELLVQQEAVNRTDLLRVLEEGWKKDETLGGLLVREGYIEQEDLRGALQAQIQNLGGRLFDQEEARFRYYPGEQVIERKDVRMNVMGLLLETARVRDEAIRSAELESQHRDDDWLGAGEPAA